MPVKLILILILIILVAVLTGFNLSNTCTIWFFHTFTNVPVFAALLTSFVLGVIITLPFTIKKRRQNKKDLVQSNQIENSKRTKRFPFAKKSNSNLQTQNENAKSENSSENQIKTEPDISDANYVVKNSEDNKSK